MTNSKRVDCVALINILWLRRRLDRNQAWFLRGCCAHPDSFQQMLAARANPKDIADAESIYRDAPPSIREIWQQDGLIAKHLAERLSDEEKEAVFAALRSPKDKVKSSQKSKEPAAPSRLREIIAAYWKAAAAIMVVGGAACIFLFSMHQPPAKADGLQVAVRNQVNQTKWVTAENRKQHVANMQSLCGWVRSMKSPGADPEETGAALFEEAGRYMADVQANDPGFQQEDPDLYRQYQKLVEEYQALKDAMAGNRPTPKDS